MKAIIFGISGQDGYYLSKLLLKNGVEVIGVSRSCDEVKGDVGDFSFVESLVKRHQPNYIFHFAANSTTHHSSLFDNHNAVGTGTVNILESVKCHCPFSKVFLSGSAMQFKNEGLPIDEKTPFHASSSYSVARIHSVYAGRYYRDTFGLQIYIGYFFNHDSPLRSEQHVNQKIIMAVKRIIKGSNEKLELGNLDVRKEFNFAGDMVEAVWTLVNQTKVYEAVIGSGNTHSIKDWTDYSFRCINRNWQDYVIVNNKFVTEYNILVSNPSLIKSLGWEKKVGFCQLADMMIGDN